MTNIIAPSARRITSESEEDQNDGEGQVFYACSPLQSFEHNFFISTPIGLPHEYIEMIHTIRNMSPSDITRIFLNTPGGHYHSTMQIMNAIEETAGTVITILDGSVASSGTFIFLSGHYKRVSPHSHFMAHNFSLGYSGKGHEFSQFSKFQEKSGDVAVRAIYNGFLNDDEIGSLIHGVDIWMDAGEVVARLRKSGHVDTAGNGLWRMNASKSEGKREDSKRDVEERGAVDLDTDWLVQTSGDEA